MNQTAAKQLAEVLPPEFMQGQYESTPAMRNAFMTVIGTYHASERPWPGPQKSVSDWYALANGKAVGVIRGRGRLSFPVVSYTPPEMVVPAFATEAVILRFASDLHQKLHDVLLDFDFGFQVNADYVVGFEYRHPSKPVSVLLTPIDEDEEGKSLSPGGFEYACLKPDGSAYGPNDYTPTEWGYISENDVDEDEALRRDLRVLITIRPAHILSAEQITQAIPL